MPKRIKTRTTIGYGFFQPQITGHSIIANSDFLNNVVSSSIAYTTNNILDNISKDTTINIPDLNITSEEILFDLGVSANKELFPNSNDNTPFNIFSTNFSDRLTNAITETTVVIETIIVEKIGEVKDNSEERESDLVSTHNNQTQMLTEDYETQIAILKGGEMGNQYGLAKEEVMEIYEKFVKAYVNKGPYYLPNMNVFHKYYMLIDAKLKEQYDDDFILLLYRDILTSLVQNRTVFFENIKLNSEVSALRKYRKEAKYKILELTKELAEFCKKTGGNYFQGKIGIKLKKPKRLIYAQALLNINMAWYIYLHDTAKIESNQYVSTIAYVNQLGPEAYKTLITLLDERFETLEDFLEEMEDKIKIDSDNSSCSDTSSSSSCSDTSSSSCSDTSSSSSCSDTTSGSDVWTTASEGEYCNDDQHYYPDKTFDEYSLYYVLNPNNGEKLLQLGGKVCVDQLDKFSLRKTCRKKRKKKKKKKKVLEKICYNIGGYDNTYITNPHTGQKMLRLCGELYVKQMSKFTVRRITRKKKHKKKKRKTSKKCDTAKIYENDYHDNIQDKLLYVIHPQTGNRCLVINGEVYIKQLKRFQTKYITNTPHCEQESNSKTFYNKPNVHQNTPTYLLDYKSDTKYLVLNGCINVNQLPQFNKNFIYNYVKNHIENYN